jgi:hypothetical protein
MAKVTGPGYGNSQYGRRQLCSSRSKHYARLLTFDPVFPIDQFPVVPSERETVDRDSHALERKDLAP